MFPSHRCPTKKKKQKKNPDLCLRSCQEQGDVGAVLPGQDGHGFLSVLDVESIDLEKWKRKKKEKWANDLV